MNMQFADEFDTIVKIKVVGVGGGGGNAVNHMVDSKIENVEYVCVNTDLHVLRASKAAECVQIGAKLTKGRGAGNRPQVGKESAEESKEEISAALKGANMVFITAGMGGGTGTGAAPVVAAIAHEMGILTVGVVTKPFKFEREQKMKQAEAGIEELSKYVDSLVVIPNERLLAGLDRPLTMKESFALSDEILWKSVKSISDLVTTLGDINLDFADITTVMKDAGIAHMATGVGSGKNKAEEAAAAVVSSPILETTLEGAGKVLAYITMSEDVLSTDVDTFLNLITQTAKTDAEVLFGYAFDETLEDTMKVTVIGTGFNTENDAIPANPDLLAETEAADKSFNDIMNIFGK